jgi:DNA-binding response OmpR family regulator
MNIFFLEDDLIQAEMVVGWLRDVGHEVQQFAAAQDILDALAGATFDLIVLDWELPHSSGLEVLGEIRARVNWHVPVLFVTQRDAEADIVQALSNGADDYMVKTATKGEFLARITALGRRLANENLEFEMGSYRFIPLSRKAFFQGEEVKLTAKEFDLSLYMFRNAGRLLAREQILRDIWGVSGLNTRTVDMHVSRIKKRLAISPENGYRMKTIYQHGYRLEEADV